MKAHIEEIRISDPQNPQPAISITEDKRVVIDGNRVKGGIVDLSFDE